MTKSVHSLREYCMVLTVPAPPLPRALRAPVFLGSLARYTGRCAPPTQPITTLLILLAKLMIYRENPAKNTNLGKKSAKVYHFSSSSIMQLQMNLNVTFWAPMALASLVAISGPKKSRF
jgi:hypothetical protein